MFQVHGVYRGRAVTVTWDAGELTGDFITAETVRAEARILDGYRVGLPTGPYTERDHLADPLSALLLVQQTLDRLDDVTGDVPEIPQVPRGAIP